MKQSRAKRAFLASALLLTFSAASLLVLEVLARTVLADSIPNFPPDERSLGYRWDPVLGWHPNPGSTLHSTGPEPYHVRHNSRGYRDAEYDPDDERARLLVVGDSFVWGYGVERRQRFTDRLQKLLAGTRVFNMGVSGYGTDQELLLLQKEFDFFNPDVVLLLYVGRDEGNDADDNGTNQRYGWYYKPYFVVGDEGLERRGVPVPRSLPYLFASAPAVLRDSQLYRLAASAYLRLMHPSLTVPDPTFELVQEMIRFVGDRGARFAVVFVDPHPALAAYCLEAEGVPCLDLSHIDDRYRFPGDGKHWTPQGNRMAALEVEAFLVSSGLVAPRSRAGPR